MLKTNYPNTGKSVDYDKLKANGWLKDGILVVDRNNDNLSWDLRHMIDTVGNALYGERVK